MPTLVSLDPLENTCAILLGKEQPRWLAVADGPQRGFIADTGRGACRGFQVPWKHPELQDTALLPEECAVTKKQKGSEVPAVVAIT